jgi:hypothetical protein
MPLDPGRYRGRIRDYGVAQSQSGQQLPTVFIAFDVVGQHDPTSGELRPCPPSTRTYYKGISPRTIGWLLADLKQIGFDKPGLEYLDPETPGAADLFDREIDVVCEHETYEGQTRERWSIHREQRRERVRRDELARLDSQYAEQIKRALGTTQSAAPAPAVTDVNNDEPI